MDIRGISCVYICTPEMGGRGGDMCTCLSA